MKSPTLAVIVAHGSPSDPEPLDLGIKELAGRIGAVCEGLPVTGATLAKSGSLEDALGRAGEGETVAVYPFFMSGGWFVSSELRRRVEKATSNSVIYSAPFGLDSSLPDLCIRRLREAIDQRGHLPGEAVVVLAAHGSQRSQASAEAAAGIQERIKAAGVFGEVRLGFVEQEPTITDAAAGLGEAPSVCMPLFATTAGHVLGDVPEQLAAAGFKGQVLAPIGEDAEVPALVARALQALNR